MWSRIGGMPRNKQHHWLAVSDLKEVYGDHWFSRWLLTRFARFLLVIGISFFAATAFVQGSNRGRCEDGKPFLRSYVASLHNSDAVRRDLLREARREGDQGEARNLRQALAQSRAQRKLLRPGIDADCDSEYPIIPFFD